MSRSHSRVVFYTQQSVSKVSLLISFLFFRHSLRPLSLWVLNFDLPSPLPPYSVSITFIRKIIAKMLSWTLSSRTFYGDRNGCASCPSLWPLATCNFWALRGWLGWLPFTLIHFVVSVNSGCSKAGCAGARDELYNYFVKGTRNCKWVSIKT